MTPAFSYLESKYPVYFYTEPYSSEMSCKDFEVHLSLHNNGHCTSVNCEDCPCRLENDATCTGNVRDLALKLIPDLIDQFPEHFL